MDAGRVERHSCANVPPAGTPQDDDLSNGVPQGATHPGPSVHQGLNPERLADRPPIHLRVAVGVELEPVEAHELDELSHRGGLLR
jgi:hypothetical protein